MSRAVLDLVLHRKMRRRDDRRKVVLKVDVVCNVGRFLKESNSHSDPIRQIDR